MLMCSALLLLTPSLTSAYTPSSMPPLRQRRGALRDAMPYAGTQLPLMARHASAVRVLSISMQNEMEPEEGWGVDNLMGMMEDAEAADSGKTTESTRPVATEDAADDSPGVPPFLFEGLIAVAALYAVYIGVGS